MTRASMSRIVIVTVVSAAVIRRSVVWQTDANNQYNRIGRSDAWGDFRYWGNRIDSLSESNLFESRIGILYSVGLGNRTRKVNNYVCPSLTLNFRWDVALSMVQCLHLVEC